MPCADSADNPISADPKSRAAGVKNNQLTLDCCAAVGAETLLGPYHSAIGEFSGKGPTEDEFKWGVESMQQVAEHAGKVGVKLACEYLNRFELYFLNSAEQMAKFVKAVNHPTCGMMYDTFHANIEEKSITAAVKTAAPHHVSRPHQRKRSQHARPRRRSIGRKAGTRCTKSSTTAG